MNENWEVNLLVGDGDVEGYNKFKLVYVASTQERYKLDQNVGQITGQQPVVLEHVGDVNAPVPARLVEANKLGNWRLSVFDDVNTPPAWDSIFNNTSILTRHFSGATSTAARHTVNGTAQEVRVQVIAEGATNATYFTVQSGYADTSRSYWTPESQQSDGTTTQRGVWFIPIFFTFEDAGKGDPFTLRNDLPSSPHMVEDSNADGLADGLTAVGTPTFSIATAAANWLTAGQSQQFITDASTNEGFQTAVVAAATSTDAIAKVLVASGPSNDILSITLRDGGSNIIDTATFDPSNPTGFSKSYTGAGRTWYEYTVSGQNTIAANFLIIVNRTSANATQISTYLVDFLYLQIDTTTIPDGWCSSSQLKNRYDPASTSAATRQQINYLDVWGIPGDLPALVRNLVYLDFVDVDDQTLTVGKHNVNRSIPDPIVVIEGESFTTGAGGSNVVDATRSNGNYRSYSTSTSTASAWPNTSDDRLAGRTWRVFAVSKTDNLLASMKLSYSVQSITVDTDYAGYTATGTWELLDLGLFNLKGISANENITNLGEVYTITVLTTAASVIDIDYVLFVPVDEFIINPGNAATPTSPTITIAGDLELVWDTKTYENTKYLGTLWNCLPHEETRYIYTINEENNVHILTREMIISLEVTPCTSHLLGTK